MQNFKELLYRFIRSITKVSRRIILVFRIHSENDKIMHLPYKNDRTKQNKTTFFTDLPTFLILLINKIAEANQWSIVNGYAQPDLWDIMDHPFLRNP